MTMGDALFISDLLQKDESGHYPLLREVILEVLREEGKGGRNE